MWREQENDNPPLDPNKLLIPGSFNSATYNAIQSSKQPGSALTSVQESPSPNMNKSKDLNLSASMPNEKYDPEPHLISNTDQTLEGRLPIQEADSINQVPIFKLPRIEEPDEPAKPGSQEPSINGSLGSPTKKDLHLHDDGIQRPVTDDAREKPQR